MAQAKDKHVSLLRDMIEGLKDDRKVWEPFLKAVDKYVATQRMLQQTAMALVQALNVVAGAALDPKSGHTSDLGTGIQQLAEGIRQVESKRGVLCKSLMDDLYTPLSNSLGTNKSWAQKFEKDYHAQHKRVVQELKKAETESAKAGKKGPDALKQAVALVNDKVKEMEQLRTSKLREAIVEDRRRYCFFIKNWVTVVGNESSMHDIAVTYLKNKTNDWTQLANSQETLPPQIENLVTVQQRSFVPIQAGGGDSGGFSQYYEEEYPDYDEAPASAKSTMRRSSISNDGSALTSFPTSAPPTAPQDNVLRPGDKCRALYDYQGDADKLSFRENDVILVQELDPSGWCLGNLNGSVGWFPSNYVEKVKQAPPPTPAPPQAPGRVTPQPSYAAPAPAPAPSRPDPFKTSGGQISGASARQTAAPPPTAQKFSTLGRPSGSDSYQPARGPPAPPPAPAVAAAPAPPPPPPVSSGGGGRGALLSSIESGPERKLKKVQTNDRSSPKLN